MAFARIFLSASSAEFRSYRDALRHDLDRPNVTVKVQEDFIAAGTPTLDKLDTYVANCDAVLHLVGDMTGALAQPSSLAVIRERYPDFAARVPALAAHLQADSPALSYTQWEAWLAIYHRKVLVIATPTKRAKRDKTFVADEAQRAAQQAHLDLLAKEERFPEIRFANADRLTIGVLSSTLHDILDKVGGAKKPVNLPYASAGALFRGRDDALAAVAARLTPGTAAAHVLRGLGGVGKTRLAIEHAWRHATDYDALLFATADSDAALQRNLAALCAGDCLNLPERQANDETEQRDAAVVWLREHARWLLILDNVDSEDAARAVEALLPRLAGGHVLITSRLANWSASVTVQALDVLSQDDAAAYLLARTQAMRRARADDAASARLLAEELGGLALALEQAAAYINQRRLELSAYLAQWRAQRDKILAWVDTRPMQYPHSVAATWQTSLDQLGASARCLLQRLAWLATQPIPESLLATPVPGDTPDDADAFDDLAELESFSLVSRAPDAPRFSVHRLVQDVTRGQLNDADALARLHDALYWVGGAFVGDPGDSRNWPVLDPLLPHALAVAAHADSTELALASAALMSNTASLLQAKALYADAAAQMTHALQIAEARDGPEQVLVVNLLNNLGSLLGRLRQPERGEQMLRRALAIETQQLGADHPKVAVKLSNLAQLLKLDPARRAEAEALMRRVLKIHEATLVPGEPAIATDLVNLADLLRAMGRADEAEPLLRRALAIDVAYYGNSHPEVAMDLANLGALLFDAGRLDEAAACEEPALAINLVQLGPDHPSSQQAGGRYVRTLQAMGRSHAEIDAIMKRLLRQISGNP